MLRIIIAGGRDFTNQALLIDEVNKFIGDLPNDQFAFVSGMARGADKLAFDLGMRQKIAVHAYPAQWDIYGKSAGYKRNTQMAENADALIAFWDGKSRGTKHMIDTAQRLNLPTVVVTY